MEPIIHKNSLIFVDKRKTDINTPGVYVINTLDGVVIKQIKICDKNCDFVMLKSINKEYKTMQININDVEIIGKVCGILIKV